MSRLPQKPTPVARPATPAPQKHLSNTDNTVDGVNPETTPVSQGFSLKEKHKAAALHILINEARRHDHQHEKHKTPDSIYRALRTDVIKCMDTKNDPTCTTAAAIERKLHNTHAGLQNQIASLGLFRSRSSGGRSPLAGGSAPQRTDASQPRR